MFKLKVEQQREIINKSMSHESNDKGQGTCVYNTKMMKLIIFSSIHIRVCVHGVEPDKNARHILHSKPLTPLAQFTDAMLQEPYIQYVCK